MKDAAHHLKHTQKKVLQAVRRENQEASINGVNHSGRNSSFFNSNNQDPRHRTQDKMNIG